MLSLLYHRREPHFTDLSQTSLPFTFVIFSFVEPGSLGQHLSENGAQNGDRQRCLNMNELCKKKMSEKSSAVWRMEGHSTEYIINAVSLLAM